MNNFKYLKVTLKDEICTVILNNPGKSNALNETLWFEIAEVFEQINRSSAKVAVILSESKNFSSGIDINFLNTILKKLESLDQNSRREALYRQIKKMQHSFNEIEKCRVPVIAAVHGICVGGALDLISACDIRLSTYQCIFSILETKLGIVADMGTLQRLPKIISDTHHKELALTSDFFSGRKAKKIGLVSRNYISKKLLHKGAFKLAKKIASHPAYAVEGTKKSINFARDHTTGASLEQIAKLNSTLLLTPESIENLEKLKKKMRI